MNNVYYNRIKYLVDHLNKCTKEYDEGRPSISDKEWDSEYFELQELEKETGLILSNSPTQVISFEVVNALKKVKHNHKMLSLDKTKSIDEVANFIGHKNGLAMCKMDGLTCSLTYKNGELISAETRGNGVEGEDILHNAKVIPSIPKQIPHKDEIVIDGEIICTYKDFESFKEEYKNPRNFASGSIRLLDSKECQRRNLTFVVWDVITSLYSEDDIEFRLEQKLNFLSSFGFTIVPYIITNGYLTDCEIVIKELQEAAKVNGYPIDGIVFKFNDCAFGRSLGETEHHFKNAIAFKMYDEEYETILKNIEWSMGRTGQISPIAVFEPVDTGDSIIEKASVHNITVMKEIFHGLPWKGQSIKTIKANMIIPQVISAEDVSETPDYQNLNFFVIPETCPECGGEVELRTENDSTFLYCINSNCPAKLINKLDHFCSKAALNIKGLSKATLEKLVEWEWVSSYMDLFELHNHRNEWIQKSGFGEKSVDKILEAIKNSAENCNLIQFITALGIPLIGNNTAKDLVKYFPTWKDFINAVDYKYEFYTLPGFGIEMNNSILNFDYDEAITLIQNYINLEKEDENNDVIDNENQLTLKNLTFVITGKLSHFKNRDELISVIEKLGGKVSGSVSKNTNYLINNDTESSSSKNVQAKKLNIPILSEENFLENFKINI